MSVKPSAKRGQGPRGRSLRVRSFKGAGSGDDASLTVSKPVYDLVTTRRRPTLQLLTTLAKAALPSAEP